MLLYHVIYRYCQFSLFFLESSKDEVVVEPEASGDPTNKNVGIGGVKTLATPAVRRLATEHNVGTHSIVSL